MQTTVDCNVVQKLNFTKGQHRIAPDNEMHPAQREEEGRESEC